jgi:hypothetical protein
MYSYIRRQLVKINIYLRKLWTQKDEPDPGLN